MEGKFLPMIGVNMQHQAAPLAKEEISRDYQAAPLANWRVRKDYQAAPLAKGSSPKG